MGLELNIDFCNGFFYTLAAEKSVIFNANWRAIFNAL